ncbi:unnamed protein product [Closterium sp. NIES-53]
MGLQPSAPVAPCVLPTSPSDATTVGIPAHEHLFGAEPSEGLPTPSPAIHFTISIVLSRCHRVALASHISHPELTISTLGGGAKRPAPAPRQYDNSVRPVPPQRQLLSRSCLPHPSPQMRAPLVTVTLRIPVLQSHLTIASTHSSPAHVDFEYSDTLCGTAWRDDYIRLHSAIRRANAAAYIPIPPPSPPPPPSLRRLLSLVPTAAAAAVPDPNLSIRTLPDASIRFLTFDQAGHCGGFGEFLVGLVSSFVAALLDRRAPRKEVWPLVARLLQEMREVRTVVVGVHVRLSDSVVRDPHATTSSATPASMTAALEAAVLTLACAKVSEPLRSIA